MVESNCGYSGSEPDSKRHRGCLIPFPANDEFEVPNLKEVTRGVFSPETIKFMGLAADALGEVAGANIRIVAGEDEDYKLWGSTYRVAKGRICVAIDAKVDSVEWKRTFSRGFWEKVSKLKGNPKRPH